MPPHPPEGDLMDVEQRQEPVPQVGVERRLFVGLAPAVFLPAAGPALLDPVNDILRVAGQGDGAGLVQGGEPRDHRRQLHAVVGGARFPARKLFLPAVIPQDCPPAARARVAGTGSVGKQLHMLHRFHFPLHPFPVRRAVCKGRSGTARGPLCPGREASPNRAADKGGGLVLRKSYRSIIPDAAPFHKRFPPPGRRRPSCPLCTRRK